MKVFLIEDDEEYAEFLKKSLRKKYRIHYFKNAEDCLVALKSINPDILITEYQLPGMSGIELYETVNSEYNNTDLKFILMSRIDDGNLVLDFIRKGIRNYVEKDQNVIDSIISIIESPY